MGMPVVWWYTVSSNRTCPIVVLLYRAYLGFNQFTFFAIWCCRCTLMCAYRT
jgi:hypothetical protein